MVSDNSERLIPPITASVSPRLQTSNRSSTSIPITPATKTVDISRVLATTHLANVSIDEIVKVEYVDDVIHVHTARSGCSHGSNESGDNNVFEIPAVLVSSSTTLTTNKNVVIPRMQLNEIHLVSTAPHSASNQSLSSSLLRETAPITVNTRDSFNQMTSSRSSLRDDFTFRYSSTHSLIYSLVYSLTHSLTYSLTHSLTHSPTHLLIYSLTHSSTHSLIYSLIYSLTQGI